MDYKFSNLDADVLAKIYSEFGYTARDIAKIVGVTESAVLHRLKKFGISPRAPVKSDINLIYLGEDKSRRKSLTESLLRNLYEKQGMSDHQIGELFGITGEAVGHRRKKFGISTNRAEERRERINHKRGLKDLSELSKEEMEKELIGCRGIKGVARKYSSTFKTTRSIVKRLGINRDDVLTRRITLSALQEKLICASLLGGAGVYERGLGSFFYKESHCLEQLDYLKWKMKILDNLVGDHSLYFETKTTDRGVDSHFASFSTDGFADLGYFRDLFYSHDGGRVRKIIPEEVLHKLDSFMLAVWYFDDGGLLSRSGYPYISSGAPEDGVDLAIEALNRLFGLAVEKKYQNGCHLLVIHEMDKFFGMIKEHVLPCFYYKFPPSYRFEIPSISGDIRNIHELVKQYNPKLWDNLDPETQNEWVENVLRYYNFVGFPHYRIAGSARMQSIVGRLRSKNVPLNNGHFVRTNSEGTRLAGTYFPHMWAAKVHGKRSAYNNYENSDRFRKVIRNVFKHHSTLSDNTIRAELRHCSTVHNFKPLIARTIYDLYCPDGGHVLDYSAGYGGRLLGAYVSKRVLQYTGTDPCQQTYFGLKKLQRRLDKYIPGKITELYNYGSENASWYPSSVDVCMSSPPYFNTEKYSDEKTQSYLKFPRIEQWADGYLRETVRNCFKSLKEGGFFIINIANIKGYELQRIAFDICIEEGLSYVKVHLMVQPSYFESDKYEPIFVFEKKVSKPHSYDEVLRQMEDEFKDLH